MWNIQSRTLAAPDPARRTGPSVVVATLLTIAAITVALADGAAGDKGSDTTSARAAATVGIGEAAAADVNAYRRILPPPIAVVAARP